MGVVGRRDTEELELINTNRKKFGLESYEDYFIKVQYADSLLNNGKPFATIPLDGNVYRTLKVENEKKCSFKVVVSYRLMMGFRNPEDAMRGYEEWLKQHNLINKED